MKVSLSTLRYIATTYQTTEKDLLDIGVEELVRLATNRLGGVEGYEALGKRYEDVVVALVVSCEPHDNSDHLHVCMIDDGGIVPNVERDTNGHIQVVCGAPNVRQGMIVAWIPPGATVPASYDKTEKFVLSSRDIRGKVSNGMLASPSELGLYDNHDGILEIDKQEVGEDLGKPGTKFSLLYGLDDVIIDIENKMFTHRPDCFGQIGVARELAAIQGLKYTSPEWYRNIPTFDNIQNQKLEVFNEAGHLVPRFMAVSMSGVKVGESPIWLKSFITRMGGKPVNNVVDISNYIMHITGQPTHAYDLAKIDGSTIGARLAKKGETIDLLNGKTATLSSDDIVISDGKAVVGIAGIMGGKNSEVSSETTDILLEVGTFGMYSIRKTAMRQGLFTDAFTRFSKGQSPLQNDRVLAKFMEILEELTGAKQSSNVFDLVDDSVSTVVERQSVHEAVSLNTDFINSRLGTELAPSDIQSILGSVEMVVVEEDGALKVSAPFWRTDIELPEDIVEEVGRLYGFDKLALKLPVRSTKPAPRNVLNDFKDKLRTILSSHGANEVLSYSFIHGDVLSKAGIKDPQEWSYHLRNALSPDLQYYRPSLLPSLLSKVHANIKSDRVRGDDNECALYEIGKVHVKGHKDGEGLPQEMERLAFIFAADDKTTNKKYAGSPYYMAKKYLSLLCGDEAIFELLESPTEYPITAPYAPNRSAIVKVGDKAIGVVGEFSDEVYRAFKLPPYASGFEIDLALLHKTFSTSPYLQMSTFPKSQQDITLRVARPTTHHQVRSVVREALEILSGESGYRFSFVPRDIFAQDGEDTKNITFRLWLWHPHKTLTTDEVNDLLERISGTAKEKIGAIRI